MKKNIFLLIIAICIPFLIYSQGKNLPNINVKTLDGKSINFSSIENEESPIVISFWATWCKPCKKELNAIAEVYEEWQEDTGVKLIAVSVDDSRTSPKVRPYVNSSDWEYEVYLDSNRELARALGVSSVPHTFLVDKNKKIVWDHRGYVDGDEEELLEKIEDLID